MNCDNVVYHLIDVETQKTPTYLNPGDGNRSVMITQEVTIEDDGTLHIWVYTKQKDDREAWLKKLMRTDILNDGLKTKIYYIVKLRDRDQEQGKPSAGLREYKKLVENAEREVLDN